MGIKCGHTYLDLAGRTYIMGILNVTPDSFSDGGLFFQEDKAVMHAEMLAEEGADVIDVGGESTRPFSKPVTIQEELRRVIPVIKTLAKRVDVPICIDTYKSEVARRALHEGASMVNDISAMRFDPEMANLVCEFGVPVILMHMQGTPQSMQIDPHYDALIPEIIEFLKERIGVAVRHGISHEKIIVDPGIGFGKTRDHNLMIIRELNQLKVLEKPVLIGTSRKAFIGDVIDKGVDERDVGTYATVAVSVLNGANMVRVHRVKESKQIAQMVDAIKRAQQ
jgi:dihydropteroate synthase